MLDASAVLAILHREPGFEVVRDRLAARAAISAVNLAEVATKLVERGLDARAALAVLERRGIVHGALEVSVFDERDATVVGELRATTRHLGLSLADRACIALAMRRDLPVVTTDRTWADAGLPVDVVLVR